MPRYFFDVHDGTDIPDPDGTELPDLNTARQEAVRYAAQLLGELDSEFWNGADWQMTVRDDAGLTLFALHFIATEAPLLRTPAGLGRQRSQ